MAIDAGLLTLVSLIIEGGKGIAKLIEMLEKVKAGEPITPEMIADIKAEREQATADALAALQSIIDGS